MTDLTDEERKLQRVIDLWMSRPTISAFNTDQALIEAVEAVTRVRLKLTEAMAFALGAKTASDLASKRLSKLAGRRRP